MRVMKVAVGMEIVVDTYAPEEQAMGWYAYWEDILTLPFLTKCRIRRAISPLQVGDEAEVIGMAPADECEREIFVMMCWERDGLFTQHHLQAAFLASGKRQRVEVTLHAH